MWGGTSEIDRLSMAHLPIEEAISELEQTLPERLATELRAFLARHPRPVPRKNGQPGKSRTARLHRLLAEWTHGAQGTEAANGKVRAFVAVTSRRSCAGCSGHLPALARADARYCSGRSRVAAHRAGRRRGALGGRTGPGARGGTGRPGTGPSPSIFEWSAALSEWLQGAVAKGVDLLDVAIGSLEFDERLPAVGLDP